MSTYTQYMLEEYCLALGSYYRTDAISGETTDSRPKSSKVWAQTTQEFDPDMVEAQDMAAIMSGCIAVNPEVGQKLIDHFDKVNADDQEAVESARNEAIELLQLSDLHFAVDHPVADYFQHLFESEKGRRLVVVVALCLALTPKVNKEAVYQFPVATTSESSKPQVPEEPDAKEEPAESPEVVPASTRTIQEVPSEAGEAQNLFMELLKPGLRGKAAMEVVLHNPSRALAILNSGELECTTRVQADVLDKIVEGVTDNGTDTAGVKDLMYQHLRSDVLAELLTGRGDLPATSVSYAPLGVVLKAVQEELGKYGHLGRLRYWVMKLADANYEHFEEFLKYSVQSVRPTIPQALAKWNIADLVLADLIDDPDLEWSAVLHTLSELRVDLVIALDEAEERGEKIGEDLEELMRCFRTPDEGGDEDDEPDDEEDEEDDDKSRGATDEAADDLDI